MQATAQSTYTCVVHIHIHSIYTLQQTADFQLVIQAIASVRSARTPNASNIKHLFTDEINDRYTAHSQFLHRRHHTLASATCFFCAQLPCRTRARVRRRVWVASHVFERDVQTRIARIRSVFGFLYLSFSLCCS